MFLLQLVDISNVGFHDMVKPLIKKAVQAVIANRYETAPNFVISAHPGIKSLDAMGNGPFNRAVVAGIKMQVANFF